MGAENSAAEPMRLLQKLESDWRTLARKKRKGTPLKVFSSKEATLNRIILLILRFSKTPLTKYELYKQIRTIKGYKHVDSKTVYRRIDALKFGRWVEKNGCRPGKVQGESALHILTIKGKVAIRLEEKSIEEFLDKALANNC